MGRRSRFKPVLCQDWPQPYRVEKRDPAAGSSHSRTAWAAAQSALGVAVVDPKAEPAKPSTAPPGARTVNRVEGPQPGRRLPFSGFQGQSGGKVSIFPANRR